MGEYDRRQQKQESRAIAYNAGGSRQLKEFVDNRINTIQRLRVKDYTDCNGYLNGEGMIRNPPNVFNFVNLLRQGHPLPDSEPIRAVKDVDMIGPDEEGRYTNKEEYTEGDDEYSLPTTKKHVLADGHHRFAAYIEAGMQLPYIEEAEDYAMCGYNWNVCNGVDYEK